ncbi:MAG: Flp pilus assembly protein CpaB [Selenomonadaceae bacterium]|nr:Flp pilus assembly protein CpaB [Selenomonadaceae bacterium]
MFTKVIKTLNNLIERLTSKQLLAGTAAIGVLIALLVYMTLTHIQSAYEAEKPVPIEMTKVVVAKTDIPRGAVIKAEMLSVKDFAVQSLPKGTSSDVESFLNLPTKLEIFAGDILTTEKVFTDYRQAGFIGMIPDNCRAITIPVDNVTGIAGLMKAGDRVDVLLLLGADGGGMHSEVILQNVLLLSINQNANRYVQKPGEKKSQETEESQEEEKKDDESSEKDKDESSESEGEEDSEDIDPNKEEIPSAGAVGTVTLALQPDEITRITAAMSIGRIYLALRPLKPRSDSMYIKETDYYTATKSSEPPQPKTPPPPPVPAIPAAPPVANVPKPALPAIPNNGVNPTPHNEGFEIIKWGN